MDLYYVDYVSVSGRSWLYRVPVGIKMGAFAVLLALLLWAKTLTIVAPVAIVLLVCAITAKLPMKLFFGLALYPLVFLVIVFLSISNLTLNSALTLGFRVFAVTESVVMLFLSTSYPAIFGALSKVLPEFLIAALFFSYRSIFVIATGLNNIRVALHLRGGVDWKRPIFSIRNLGTALGHFLANSIDSSERMADSLRIRGFSNRIYYVDGKNE